MSARDDQLWERVNEALDERRDPVEDEAVAELLAGEPERVAELAALTRALEVIGTSRAKGPPALAGSTRPAGRLKPAVRAAAAAAVLVLAVLSWWFATRPVSRITIGTPLRAIDVVRPFPPDASAVVSWSVRVERREADVTTSDALGSDGIRTTDTSTVESNAESARIVVHSFTRLP